MNPMANVKVEGVDALLADFKKFRVQAKKAVKRGVDRTARAIAKDAVSKLKAGGHWITGRLASSIHPELKQGQVFNYKTKAGSFDGALKEPIGEMEAVTGTNVHYAPDIEFGTKPHLIEAEPGGVLAFQMSTASSLKGESLYFNKKTGKYNKSKSSGTTIFATHVHHPGTKADSFLGYAAVKNDKNLKKWVEEELSKITKG